MKRLLKKAIQNLLLTKKATIQNIEALVSGNKEMKQQLKKELICNATVKDIMPDYKTFIQEIAKKIK